MLRHKKLVAFWGLSTFIAFLAYLCMSGFYIFEEKSKWSVPFMLGNARYNYATISLIILCIGVVLLVMAALLFNSKTGNVIAVSLAMLLICVRYAMLIFIKNVHSDKFNIFCKNDWVISSGNVMDPLLKYLAVGVFLFALLAISPIPVMQNIMVIITSVCMIGYEVVSVLSFFLPNGTSISIYKFCADSGYTMLIFKEIVSLVFIILLAVLCILIVMYRTKDIQSDMVNRYAEDELQNVEMAPSAVSQEFTQATGEQTSI